MVTLAYFFFAALAGVLLLDGIAEFRQADNLGFWAVATVISGAMAYATLSNERLVHLAMFSLGTCITGAVILFLNAEALIPGSGAAGSLDGLRLPLVAAIAALLLMVILGNGFVAGVLSALAIFAVVAFFTQLLPQRVITATGNIQRVTAVNGSMTLPGFRALGPAEQAAVIQAAAECSTLSSSAFIGLGGMVDVVFVSPIWSSLPLTATAVDAWYRTNRVDVIKMRCL
ncbi:MAG: hypothetical protein AAGA32_06720 [Pseudomonadota bacterium]